MYDTQIAPDKRGSPLNIFLISPQKQVLTYVLGEKEEKIHTFNIRLGKGPNQELCIDSSNILPQTIALHNKGI